MATLNKFTKTLSIDEKAEIKEKFTEVSVELKSRLSLYKNLLLYMCILNCV